MAFIRKHKTIIIKILKAIYNITLFLCIPFILFLIVEKLNFVEALNLHKTYIYLNLHWYYLFYLFLFAITNSVRISFISGSVMLYLFGLTNHFTILYKGSTIIPTDIFSLSVGIHVLQNYKIEITPTILITLLIIVAIIILSIFAKFKIKNLKIKICSSIIILIACFSFMNIYLDTEFLESKTLTPFQFNQTNASKVRGLVTNFTSNIPSLIVKAPNGYNPKNLENETKEYIYNDVTNSIIDNALLPPNNQKPNIIVIMNESFTDLNVVGKLNTNKDPLEFINSLDKNTIRGRITVPPFGGGTSNSEYEFITGNSLVSLPFGCVPYNQFIDDEIPSLVSVLNERGYYSLAMHPYSPKGWSRDVVYPHLGFKDFIYDTSFTNKDKYRSFISDEAGYNKIIELYNNKPKDEPFFMFNVTMQNHGGYEYTPFESTIKLNGYKKTYSDAEQYLTLIDKSDEAYKKLLQYFGNVDEPTIILMFGDHFPKLDDGFYNELMKSDVNPQDTYNGYLTPFIFWTNYDLGISTQNYGNISVNYLSSILLKLSGLEMPIYNSFLLNMMQKMPIISINGCYDANGVKIEPKDKNSEFYDEIEMYHKLNYNALLDKKNLQENIFY